MNRYVWSLMVVGLVTLGSGGPANAAAQGPSGQPGVGIDVGGFYNGIHLIYAVDPHLQLGAQFGMGLWSGGGTTVSGLLFAPYGRYSLGPVIGDLSPFMQAELAMFVGNYYGVASGAGAALSASGGFSYNVSSTFVVSARVEILQLMFGSAGGSVFGFGTLTPTLSADWFF